MVFSDLAVEARTIDAQEVGCRLLVAARSLQCLFDDQLFDVFERHVGGHVPAHALQSAFGQRPVIEGKIDGLDLVSFSQQDGALDDVLQLAHVAGPGVPEETLIGRL